MLKISRLTDYAVVLLSQLIEKLPDEITSAKNLSKSCGLPLPTVMKLLKLMAQAGLIKAKRGVMGGYVVTYDLSNLSLLKFIEIFEGPTNIIDCLSSNNSCQISNQCLQKNGWHMVNDEIKKLLKEIKLLDFLPKKGVYNHG